jgi:hypothetical protein
MPMVKMFTWLCTVLLSFDQCMALAQMVMMQTSLMSMCHSVMSLWLLSKGWAFAPFEGGLEIAVKASPAEVVEETPAADVCGIAMF